MKAHKNIKIVIALILLLAVSCGWEYKVKTIIYPDGSCERIFTVTAEDTIHDFFDELEYPIPIDSTWSLTYSTDTTEDGDTVIIHTATKYFANVNELHCLYDTDTSQHGHLERKVSLQKRFRWFYTFYNYSETYQKLFDQPSLENYLDSVQYGYAMLPSEEQDVYLKEKFDSLEAAQFDEVVENGIDRWFEVAIFNSCLSAFDNSLIEIEHLPISESEYLKIRDSLITRLDKGIDVIDLDGRIYKGLAYAFGFDSITFQSLEETESYKSYINKVDLLEEYIWDEEYDNIVQMPGLIIETNAQQISEIQEVIWRVDIMRYLTSDYIMYVQSRVVNIWAFWVSGGFILLVILAFILRKVIKS